MILLTLLLAGLELHAASGSHPKPAPKKQPPKVVMSPPPIVSVPVMVQAPPPPYIRTPSPPPPSVAELAAPPLDLPIQKQPRLDKFYPKPLRKAGVEDSATINLTIDRTGKVTACAIRSAPANPAFAEPACALGSKLQFVPVWTDYPGPLPIKVAWRAGDVALVRAAKPKGASIVPGSVTISESDYPVSMRRADIAGRVVARIAIPADGKASDCKIEWANVPPAFDRATCAVVLRGQFVPARDEFGVAVPGQIVQAVRWKLEESDPIPAASYSITVKLLVSADHKIMSCATSVTGAVPAGVVAEQCDKEANEQLLTFPKLAGIRGHAATITRQFALTMDGDPAFTPARARMPRAAWGVYLHRLTHFEITPDGTMGRCTVVEAVGDVNTFCEEKMGPYVAVTGADAARPRAASFYTSLIAEPAP